MDNNFKIKRNKLKSYNIRLNSTCIDTTYLSYYELIDLKNLRDSAIKELNIKDNINFTRRIRRNLIELFNNTNIKTIKIVLQNPSNRFLMSISELIRKNTSIDQIKLFFVLQKKFSLNNIQNLSWIRFINTIQDRLVSIRNTPFTNGDIEMNKLLFSNSNIKEIEINDLHIQLYLLDGYSDLVNFVLSTNKCLDELCLYAKYTKITKQFIECISESKIKAEINTLILHELSSENILVLIDIASLFKIETIKLFLIDLSDIKQILEHILNLSFNSLNTVKRIIINTNEDLDLGIITELVSTHDYTIQKIPKIFIEGFKEVIINNNNSNNSKITCLYEKNRYYYDNYYTLYLLEDHLLDIYNFTEFLYILFNEPIYLRCLSIKHKQKDMRLKENTESINTSNNQSNIINQMKDIYIKFKADNIHSKRIKFDFLSLYFNLDSPELNIYYFTLLEIMIDMNIRIDSLILNLCSINELVNFLNKNKKLRNPNIENISIITSIANKEDVCKLYQYSDLIEGKITVQIENNINLNKEGDQEELIKIFYPKLQKNVNFIALHKNKNPLIHRISHKKDINDYIEKNKQRTFEYCETQSCLKKISSLEINFKNLDLKDAHKLYTFLKEFQYNINRSHYKSLINRETYFIIKVNSIILETLIDIKYREGDLYNSSTIWSIKIKRKEKRYVSKHNIF